MKLENNLDLLINEPEEYQLCGRVFKVYDMKYIKSLKVVSMYQDTKKILTDNRREGQTAVDVLSNFDIAKKYQKKIIEVCLFIIEPEGFFKKIHHRLFAKKWLSNATTKQLEKFIHIILKPILGEDTLKKLEAVKKATS